MTLTCLLYQVDDKLLPAVLTVLQSVGRQSGVSFRIQMRTNNYASAKRCIETFPGILFLLTCVKDVTGEENKDALRLGRLAVHKNRDNYVVYCATNSKTMIAMVPFCVKATGIMMAPMFTNGSALRLMMDLACDYKALWDSQAGDNEDWLNIKVNGAIVRLNQNEICAIVADNKMVEVCTLTENYQTYASISGMLKSLGERFLQCHRSCIINREHVQYISFREGNIVMTNGMTIPLSRTFHKAMNQMLETTDKRAGVQE